MAEHNEPPINQRSFIRIPRRPHDVARRGTTGGDDGARPQPGQRPPPREHRSDEHERIVIPRQDRGSGPAANLDVDLREVRYGAASRGPYLRVVRRKAKFVKAAPGHLEATLLASEPPGAVGALFAKAKAKVIGTPLATSRLLHERLSNVQALSVLGSDPLSSSAYATEETLIILATAGTAALIYSLPIALVVALLMTIVVVSYRQTQKAYPSGGGAYIVAHENLGRLPGLTAAAALIVDYVLLVSVSVAAGVAAITSAVPELFEWRVGLSIVVIALFTAGNLRGIRESGAIFAAPTYFFILAMGGVVAVGLVRVLIGDAPGSVFHAAPPREQVVATEGLTLWLILRAFSSGGAALTGVEAMSNNIPNFKPPESENARKTLTIMAAIAIYLFIGITFLASRYGIVPAEDETVVSQLGRLILGETFLYFGYQAATALVLFLAANTSFYDFPLLSAILARDKYMPRQFSFRGDRLAYSHGILVLAGVATVLLVIYGADTTKLIPLYAVGVFVSFTLSQSGMVLHWLGVKEPGWRVSLAINGAGAVTTGVVAIVIGATKFTHGAWISVLMMAVLAGLFVLIRRHYDWFKARVEVSADEIPSIPAAVSIQPGGPATHVMVPVDEINRITMGAIGLAREISPLVTAVHVTDDRQAAENLRSRWEASLPDVPLLVIESPYRAFVAPMVALVRQVQENRPRQKITFVLPGFSTRHWWERFLHNRDAQRLRGALRELGEVTVVDFKFDLKHGKAPA